MVSVCVLPLFEGYNKSTSFSGFITYLKNDIMLRKLSLKKPSHEERVFTPTLKNIKSIKTISPSRV